MVADERVLGFGGSGECRFCGRSFKRVRQHEHLCDKNTEPDMAEFRAATRARALANHKKAVEAKVMRGWLTRNGMTHLVKPYRKRRKSTSLKLKLHFLRIAAMGREVRRLKRLAGPVITNKKWNVLPPGAAVSTSRNESTPNGFRAVGINRDGSSQVDFWTEVDKEF